MGQHSKIQTLKRTHFCIYPICLVWLLSADTFRGHQACGIPVRSLSPSCCPPHGAQATAWSFHPPPCRNPGNGVRPTFSCFDITLQLQSRYVGPRKSPCGHRATILYVENTKVTMLHVQQNTQSLFWPRKKPLRAPHQEHWITQIFHFDKILFIISNY